MYEDLLESINTRAFEDDTNNPYPLVMPAPLEEDKSPGFLGSVSRGIDETQGMLYGAAGLMGSATGIDRLKDWGMEGYRRNMEEAQANAPTVRFSEIDSIGDAGTWAVETFGALVPTMVEAAVGAFLGGGVVGMAVKKGIQKGVQKKLSETVLRKSIDKAVKEGLETQAGKALAKELGEEVAEATLKKQVTAGALKKLGAKVGLGAAVLPMESGGNYGELMEEHGVDAPLSSLAFGGAATALEYLGGNIKLIDKFVPGASTAFSNALSSGNGNVIKRVAREILKNAPAEALQEAGQETFSILNTVANTEERLLTPEHIGQVIESAVAGSLGGGAGGVLSGVVSRKSAARDILLDEDEKDATSKELLTGEKEVEEPAPEFTGADSLDAEEAAAAFEDEALETVAEAETKEPVAPKWLEDLTDSQIQKRIANLEKTRTVRGLSGKQAENLALLQQELENRGIIAPQEKEEVTDDSQKEGRLARSEREGEKPGRAVPEPDAGEEKIEASGVFQEKTADETGPEKVVKAEETSRPKEKSILDREISYDQNNIRDWFVEPENWDNKKRLTYREVAHKIAEDKGLEFRIETKPADKSRPLGEAIKEYVVYLDGKRLRSFPKEVYDIARSVRPQPPEPPEAKPSEAAESTISGKGNQEHSFSSTQVNLPEPDAREVKKLASQIPDSDKLTGQQGAPKIPVTKSIPQADTLAGGNEGKDKPSGAMSVKTPTTVAEIPTKDIHSDPTRFQYKRHMGKGGVSDKLRNIKSFDTELGGIISVWQDPADGRTYVVNGHHRLELARRTEKKTLTVRYLGAKTAKEAKFRGALINIAENQGTPEDAAEIFRAEKLSAEQLENRYNISLKGDIAKKGMALSRLHPAIFDDVQKGEFPQSWAVVIGENLENQDAQIELIKLINREKKKGKNINAGIVEQLIKDLSGVATKKEEQITLFGKEVTERPLLIERAELRDYAVKKLAADKRLFGLVSKKEKAKRLTSLARNVIDINENKAIAGEADTIRKVFEVLAGSKGEISDALNESAKELSDAKGQRRNEIKQAFLERLREIAPRIISGGKRSGVSGSRTDAERRLDKSFQQVKEALGVFGQKKPMQQTLWGMPEKKEKRAPWEAQLDLFTEKVEHQIQPGLFKDFIKKSEPVAKKTPGKVYEPEKGSTVEGAGRWVSTSPTGRVFKAPSLVAKNASEVASLLSSIGKQARESLYTVTVDKNGKILEIFEHSKGTKSGSPAHPIEIAGHILNIPEADTVYFAHNHPGGSTTASREDADVARMIRNILGLKDIKTKAFVITKDKWRGIESDEIESDIKPISQKEKIDVVESLLGGKPGETIDNSLKFKKVLADKYNNKEGILFLDSKLHDLGFMPWPKGKSIKEASAQIIAAAEALNATGYAINLTKPITHKNRAGFIDSLARILGKYSLQIFDIHEQGRSYADTGLMGAIGKTSAGRFSELESSDILFLRTDSRRKTSHKGAEHGKETENTERLKKDIAEYLEKDLPRGMLTEAEPGQVHDTTAAYGRRLAEIFGKRVVYFNNSRPDIYAFDGATLPSSPDVIYIDANSSKPHMVVVGHELLHELRRDHEDIYNLFLDAVSDEIQNFEDYRTELDKLTEKEGRKLEEHRVYEELLADFIGDRMMEQSFWDKIAQKQPTIFEKLVSFVKKFLNKILNKLVYKDSTSQYFKDIKKARDAAIDALAEYAKRQTVLKKAGKKEKGASSLREDMPLFKRREANTKKIDTAGILPEEVEKRMAKSRGVPKTPFLEKVKEQLKELKHQRHHFPKLQTIEDKGQRARLTDILRQHQEIPQTVKHKTIQFLQAITENLSKDGYEAYRMNIILADMVRDINKGLIHDGNLPFGFKTTDEVIDAYEKYQEIARNNSEVAEALERRTKMVNDIKRRLVNAKLLKKEVLKDEDYFHHQVLMFWEEKYGLATGSKDVRTHWRPWMAARKGSALDYNTEYVEAEFVAISQQLAQLETVETLKRIKKEADLYAKLKQQAKAANIKKLWDKLRKEGRLETDPLTGKEKDPLLPWKQKIAMSNTKLAKMAADGLLEYDSEWQEIVDALADSYKAWEANKDDIPDYPTPGVDDARWFHFLSYLVNTHKPGANHAATVFKAIRGRDKYIQDTLGDGFLTYRNFIPKGYKQWKPDPGKGWFWANTVADNVLQKMIDGEIDPSDVEFRKVLAKGRALIWVIPEGLADTMDNFHDYGEPSHIGKMADWTQSAWKQYILLNPYSVVRYNLNNMSGDLDAVLAYAPEIASKKYAHQAMKDLWKWHRRKKLPAAVQAELDHARKLGVIGSGFSVQEVDDALKILSMDKFVRDVILDEKPNWFSPRTWGEKYWKTVQNMTAWRENILRLAAYRYFKNNDDKRLYGASKPQEIDAIKNSDERAAKLARELLGDYGNISKTGEWIRKRLMPFYSWLEINAPRYVYMMRNTKYENREAGSVKGRMVAVGGKKLILSASKMALRASMLYGAIMLWNMLMFPDEEEELGESGRNQLHIILGRREDGSIITLRFQGALSDALSFFGLEDWPADMRDVLEGKQTVLEKLKEAPKALLNRGVQAIRPEIKMFAELTTGKSIYPDVTRPLPIRDRLEHALRTFKLDKPYRALIGRPGRGKTPGASRATQAMQHFINDLKSVLVYESDPGMLAYYDVRKMVFDWLAKQGDEKRFGGRPTKKGNALYWYKQAMKFGDLDAAQRYLAKYYELGGTPKSKLQSIKFAHPLSSIPKTKRFAFRRSLTPAQEAVLKRALGWYKKTYK